MFYHVKQKIKQDDLSGKLNDWAGLGFAGHFAGGHKQNRGGVVDGDVTVSPAYHRAVLALHTAAAQDGAAVEQARLYAVGDAGGNVLAGKIADHTAGKGFI